MEQCVKTDIKEFFKENTKVTQLQQLVGINAWCAFICTSAHRPLVYQWGRDSKRRGRERDREIVGVFYRMLANKMFYVSMRGSKANLAFHGSEILCTELQGRWCAERLGSSKTTSWPKHPGLSIPTKCEQAKSFQMWFPHNAATFTQHRVLGSSHWTI